MSFSNDWLGIEEEHPQESTQKDIDYIALLRQQQQQQLQALAYRQEMLNRQQQAQLQARNIRDVVNYPLLQQQFLQRQGIPNQPGAQVPQSAGYHQAQIQQMQLIQQQLIEQKRLNQGHLSRATPSLTNMTLAMVSESNLSPNMTNAISSPPVHSPNLVSNIPVGAADSWTKGYLNFMKNLGKEVKMLPKINGQLLDLKSFTHFVVDLGGFDKVMSENKWPQVASALGLPVDTSEKVAFLYKTLLLDFERRVFPGLSLLAQSEMRENMVNISVMKPTTSVQVEVVNPQNLLSVRQSTDAHSIESSLESTGRPAPNPHTNLNALSAGSSALRDPTPNIYMPKVRKISSYGGYDDAIFGLANTSQKSPLSTLGMMNFLIKGDIDLYRIKMSLKSRLDSDCQYAIDSILTVSSQPRASVTLERHPDMMDALFDLLSDCLQEAFGKLNLTSVSIHPKLRKIMTYYQLYDIEVESWGEFRNVTEPTFQNRQFMLAERILAMSTTLRNFSFDQANAAFLSKHISFWPVTHSILRICLDNDSNAWSPLTLREAGILDHRKNIVIIFSNVGSQIKIPSESCQLVLNLLEDFLSVSDSIYSYAALEALAKLSLVEENHKCFVSASNLKVLIESIANFLPIQGFHLNSSQDIAAQWELASLFIYNVSAMDDDHGRFLIIKSRNVIRIVIRIASVGIKTGNDIHADYIRIITLRMLKCIRELASNDDFRGSLSVYENLIFSMMMDIRVMPNSSSEFKTQAGIIISDILKSLEGTANLNI